MPTTLSHNFITTLAPNRDHLYALALAAVAASPTANDVSPSALHARAEVILHSALRDAFTHYAQNPTLNPLTEIESQLQSPSAASPLTIPNSPFNPMPADIWARLVAAIQVEAARSEHSRALNPDSVLLTPDPLLAPKKTIGTGGDPDGFDLPPTSRFLLAGIIVILLALGITIYLLTRTVTPPATRPASPASAPSSR